MQTTYWWEAFVLTSWQSLLQALFCTMTHSSMQLQYKGSFIFHFFKNDKFLTFFFELAFTDNKAKKHFSLSLHNFDDCLTNVKLKKWDCCTIKLIYSEKATKFCEIPTLLLSYVVPVKSKSEILQNCGLLRIFELYTTNQNISRVVLTL